MTSTMSSGGNNGFLFPDSSSHGGGGPDSYPDSPTGHYSSQTSSSSLHHYGDEDDEDDELSEAHASRELFRRGARSHRGEDSEVSDSEIEESDALLSVYDDLNAQPQSTPHGTRSKGSSHRMGSSSVGEYSDGGYSRSGYSDEYSEGYGEEEEGISDDLMSIASSVIGDVVGHRSGEYSDYSSDYSGYSGYSDGEESGEGTNYGQMLYAEAKALQRKKAKAQLDHTLELRKQTEPKSSKKSTRKSSEDFHRRQNQLRASRERRKKERADEIQNTTYTFKPNLGASHAFNDKALADRPSDVLVTMAQYKTKRDKKLEELRSRVGEDRPRAQYKRRKCAVNDAVDARIDGDDGEAGTPSAGGVHNRLYAAALAKKQQQETLDAEKLAAEIKAEHEENAHMKTFRVKLPSAQQEEASNRLHNLAMAKVEAQRMREEKAAARIQTIPATKNSKKIMGRKYRNVVDTAVDAAWVEVWEEDYLAAEDEAFEAAEAAAAAEAAVEEKEASPLPANGALPIPHPPADSHAHGIPVVPVVVNKVSGTESGSSESGSDSDDFRRSDLESGAASAISSPACSPQRHPAADGAALASMKSAARGFLGEIGASESAFPSMQSLGEHSEMEGEEIPTTNISAPLPLPSPPPVEEDEEAPKDASGDEGDTSALGASMIVAEAQDMEGPEPPMPPQEPGAVPEEMDLALFEAALMELQFLPPYYVRVFGHSLQPPQHLAALQNDPLANQVQWAFHATSTQVELQEAVLRVWAMIAFLCAEVIRMGAESEQGEVEAEDVLESVRETLAYATADEDALARLTTASVLDLDAAGATLDTLVRDAHEELKDVEDVSEVAPLAGDVPESVNFSDLAFVRVPMVAGKDFLFRVFHLQLQRKVSDPSYVFALKFDGTTDLPRFSADSFPQKYLRAFATSCTTMRSIELHAAPRTVPVPPSPIERPPEPTMDPEERAEARARLERGYSRRSVRRTTEANALQKFYEDHTFRPKINPVSHLLAATRDQKLRKKRVLERGRSAPGSPGSPNAKKAADRRNMSSLDKEVADHCTFKPTLLAKNSASRPGTPRSNTRARPTIPQALNDSTFGTGRYDAIPNTVEMSTPSLLDPALPNGAGAAILRMRKGWVDRVEKNNSLKRPSVPSAQRAALGTGPGGRSHSLLHTSVVARSGRAGGHNSVAHSPRSLVASPRGVATPRGSGSVVASPSTGGPQSAQRQAQRQAVEVERFDLPSPTAAERRRSRSASRSRLGIERSRSRTREEEYPPSHPQHSAPRHFVDSDDSLMEAAAPGEEEAEYYSEEEEAEVPVFSISMHVGGGNYSVVEVYEGETAAEVASRVCDDIITTDPADSIEVAAGKRNKVRDALTAYIAERMREVANSQ